MKRRPVKKLGEYEKTLDLCPTCSKPLDEHTTDQKFYCWMCEPNAD